MFKRTFVIMSALSLCLWAAGCGKDDKKGGDKKSESSDKGDKGDKGDPPEGKAPSKDEVAKIDCEKGFAQSVECVKKGGAMSEQMIKGMEENKKNTIQACEMVKSMYDPKKPTMVMGANQWIKYTNGKCD